MKNFHRPRRGRTIWLVNSTAIRVSKIYMKLQTLNPWCFQRDMCDLSEVVSVIGIV